MVVCLVLASGFTYSSPIFSDDGDDIYPHLAVGGGWATILTVTNTTDSHWRIEIYVVGDETGFQRDIPGSNVLFVPINLTVNGHRYCLDSSQDWSGSPRIDLRHPAGPGPPPGCQVDEGGIGRVLGPGENELGPGDTASFLFESNWSQVQSGFIVLKGRSGIISTLRYEHRFSNGDIFDSVGVIPNRALGDTDRLLIHVEVDETKDTGIAFVPRHVELEPRQFENEFHEFSIGIGLYDEQGKQVRFKVLKVVAHLSKFVSEIFPDVLRRHRRSGPFKGYIAIDGAPFNDPVVAIGLLFERRRFGWEVTSLPVSPMADRLQTRATKGGGE